MAPKTSQQSFRILKKRCAKYTKDPSYVFKSCVYQSNVYLLVLQKLPDTLTNEDRDNVDDVLCAKFRADKLKVIKIYNVFNPKFVRKSLVNSSLTDNTPNTEYLVGNIVYPDKYDNTSNNVCSNGIHYYISIKPAFYYHSIIFAPLWKNAKRMVWYDNGRVHSTGYYVNNEKSGTWTWYFRNGDILKKGKYQHGKRNGLWISFHENGKLDEKGSYIDDEKFGTWIFCYPDGKVYSKGYFEHDDEIGPVDFFTRDGVKMLI